MTRQALVMLVVGAVAYYAFLKFRAVVDGPPWAPVPAHVKKHAGA